jgi:ubiquinone/menaquinone biosynthesis C-methylase UbiE
MSNKIKLGGPTDYNFTLPIIRYNLSIPYLKYRNSLLDFGSGYGANTVLFKDDFKNIIGLEVEDNFMKEAEIMRQKMKVKNIKYQLYDGNTIPYSSAFFDAVVSYEVIEHTQNDFLALKEINRVLKKNGRLAITVPNKWYLMETHGFDLPYFKTFKTNRIPFLSWLPSPIHSRYAEARIYTRRRITKLLVDAGFKIVVHEYIQAPFDKVKNSTLKKILKTTFLIIGHSPLKIIGVAHFIVAEKVDEK